MSKKGQLVCVGLGMTLGAHMTPASLHQIKTADVVFIAASNGVVEKWVESINPNSRSLQPLYSEGKSRKQTYNEMVDIMLSEVRCGKKVCGAFYGHPGVFAYSSRKAIEIAIKEGFLAYMEPGISAESCLYADLLLDPGTVGCQHFETSQFMYFNRNIDVAALLILWQVGLAGDLKSQSFTTTQGKLELLQQKLLKLYPCNHQVIIYEAKVLPTDNVRIEFVELCELNTKKLTMNSTLVVPPSVSLIDIKDEAMLNKESK